jgi:ribosomal protein S18 acetylase RimI-like enzyme
MVELRLHSYLCVKAELDHAVVSLPSFSLSVHATDTSPETNCAFPRAQPPEEWSRAILTLRRAFVERQRRPYVRFLESLSPALASALSVAGFVEVQRASVMLCTPETLHFPSAVSGLTLHSLSSTSPFEDVEAGWNLNALGFDPTAALATPEDVERFRRSLVTSRAFIARLNGEGVGAGMFDEVRNGVTELAGITTLAPYRCRGIAAALTAGATQSAFDQGVQLAFLVAANEQAGRVYERIGFRQLTTLLEWSVPQAEVLEQ